MNTWSLSHFTANHLNLVYSVFIVLKAYLVKLAAGREEPYLWYISPFPASHMKIEYYHPSFLPCISPKSKPPGIPTLIIPINRNWCQAHQRPLYFKLHIKVDSSLHNRVGASSRNPAGFRNRGSDCNICFMFAFFYQTLRKGVVFMIKVSQ